MGGIIGSPGSMNMVCPDNIGRDSWDRGGQESVVFCNSPQEMGEEALTELIPFRKYVVIVVVVVVVVVVVEYYFFLINIIDGPPKFAPLVSPQRFVCFQRIVHLASTKR